MPPRTVTGGSISGLGFYHIHLSHTYFWGDVAYADADIVVRFVDRHTLHAEHTPKNRAFVSVFQKFDRRSSCPGVKFY
ncbi:MAG: hypothetical protein WBB29_00760 [Geitlerinemataceae cyanobacterium]